MAVFLNDSWRKKYGAWAVVTGASDGIGLEMAKHLAMAKLNVVLVARRRAILEQVAANFQGVEGLVVDADLSQDSGIERVIEATQELEVGLLVACAGFGTSGQFIQQDLEKELTMLTVNCRTVAIMSHHYGKRFAEQGRGGIILMSSLLAFQGTPYSAHYAATKAYIQVLAEGLHTELAPLGVDVLSSAPGPVESGFAAQANMKMGLAGKPDVVARETLNMLGRKTTVRPGGVSKFLEGSLSFLPRVGRVWAMGRVMQGMVQSD